MKLTQILLILGFRRIDKQLLGMQRNCIVGHWSKLTFAMPRLVHFRGAEHSKGSKTQYNLNL